MPRAYAVVAVLGLTMLFPSPAESAPSLKKSMWGPTRVDGQSVFPTYRDLGVGIFQMSLRWNNVAPRKPAKPSDPNDPAYQWDAEVDYAIKEAARYGIRVSMLLQGAPRWANGGKPSNWAPKRARAFGTFAAAASRRYPRIKHWMIWGEPSRQANFRPLPRFEAKGPRRYARILDASYASLKKVNRRNIVIGGNTFTTGDVTPRQFIKNMRLPGGRRPRMDLYGHNPFTRRKPDLRKPPLGYGYADFSDLDTLARWLDRYQGKRRGKRIRLFLSEFFVPTDHRNHEFNFWVDRKTQAEWLRAGLKIVRRWHRIYTLGWFRLYDDPPRPSGDEVNRGLVDFYGRPKPAFYAYKKG